MIIINHPTFEKPIEFYDDSVNVLVVENQKQMFSYVDELYHQFNGEEGSFQVYSELSKLGFNKIKLFLSPIDLNSNSKEITTHIVHALSKFALDEDNYVNSNDHLQEMNSYLRKIVFDYDSSLSFDGLTIVDLFKASDIKFGDIYNSFVEKILNHLECCKKYLHTQIFIFVNLKSFLCDDDLSLFYDAVIYEKMNVLLIESAYRNYVGKERVTIIDKDLCEIHSSDR